MKKRLISFILILALTVSVLPPLVSATATWDILYKLFIENEEYLSFGQDYYTGSDSLPITFALHDLDGDGGPELIVSNGCPYAAGMYAYVYEFDGKHIQYLGTQGFLGYGGVYAPDSRYPGIYYENGRGDTREGYYYYVEDEELYQELVLTVKWDSESRLNIPEQITRDTDLYNTFCEYSSGAYVNKGFPKINMLTAAEIRSMSWYEFCRPFTSNWSNGYFDDVPENAYYRDAVRWAVENGITNGVDYDQAIFGPDYPCTRGQVVTFLWRAVGSPEPKSGWNPFIDIKERAFYYKAVLWAVENGITKGMTENTFAPDATCTRAQIVTFLWRANGSPKAANAANPFKDVSTDGFYYPAMLWAVKNGITTGTSKTTFSPNIICTRGQVVTFLYRAA